MPTMRWWLVFVADVLLCLMVAVIAGVVAGIGGFVEAIVEDVLFAWHRPVGGR